MGHGFWETLGSISGSGRPSLVGRALRAPRAVAVMGFETEPRRYSVSAVAGTEFSRSAIPKPLTTRTPFWTTATETPGALLAAMNCEMALSILACLSGETVVV